METITELRAQLHAHLASMYATGVVDAYFQELQALDEGSAAPGYVAEVIDIFLNDGDSILRDIDGLLNQPLAEVDFHKVDAMVQQLKGSSSTVGAKKVKLACMDFQQFYTAKNKKQCLMALAVLKSDFCELRNKLQTLMQLEQQVASLDTMW
ncbi:hypothetical protein ZWY2020_054155 [Hordeum vulgare]|uniref:Histidine-containing phosphotransfer protein n=1 Tax=Hordeum vulgare subsp. vulgare TaxID=112509 RepID=A0A8I6XEX6_HORVV|nr:hypothetical protein ZWY2020_054155 [Hordeum vulgare]